MNASELKLYNTAGVLDACVWWKADTVINLTKGKILSALNKSLKMNKEYDEQYPGITFDGIEIVASAERKFRFSDGQVITASCAEEAKAKHKATAAQEFGVLDADKGGDKRAEIELPKSNAMFVIQRKDGTFMTTNTTIKYGHDDVRFVKDINKADIFFYANRAKGIMNYVKEYNPSFEMEVKKLKLSV